MEGESIVNIYGDSLMKATVVDSAFHYSSIFRQFIEKLWSGFSIKIQNRSHFGSTVSNGRAVLDRDLARGLDCGFALLEYGGNDCDYDWAAISKSPHETHLPKTTLDDFRATLTKMADDISRAGVQPVLMTLPPIDAERYLKFLELRGNAPENILVWLGDLQMIYRFHESYSNAISRLAVEKNLPCVDVRSYFLDKHNYRDLISIDGIHATPEGYALIYTAFEDFVRTR